MKNLVILGVPRAGKSRLSTMAAQHIGMAGYPVALIAMDAVKNGVRGIWDKNIWWQIFVRPFRHIFPMVMRQSNRKLRRQIIRFVAGFVGEATTNSLVVMEGSYIPVADAVKMFPADKFKICAVGYPDIDVETKLKNVRKFDGKTRLYGNRSDKYTRKALMANIEWSRRIQADCARHGITFINTSHDYMGELERFVANLDAFLELPKQV